jgi:hypothetical protein
VKLAPPAEKLPTALLAIPAIVALALKLTRNVAIMATVAILAVSWFLLVGTLRLSLVVKPVHPHPILGAVADGLYFNMHSTRLVQNSHSARIFL